MLDLAIFRILLSKWTFKYSEYLKVLQIECMWYQYIILSYLIWYILNFQDALLKSNEVFETFKQEIEKVYTFIQTTFHLGTHFLISLVSDSLCNSHDMLILN